MNTKDTNITLDRINIPEDVNFIKINQFKGNTCLKHISIHENVSHIYGGAFENCIGLTSIILPEKLSCIYSRTFYGCSSLSSVKIPQGVKSIGDSAFEGCSSLTNIDIPDSVTYIGDFAFKGCDNLQKINISPNNPANYFIPKKYVSGDILKREKKIVKLSITFHYGWDKNDTFYFLKGEELKSVKLLEKHFDEKDSSYIREIINKYGSLDKYIDEILCKRKYDHRWGLKKDADLLEINGFNPGSVCDIRVCLFEEPLFEKHNMECDWMAHAFQSRESVESLYALHDYCSNVAIHIKEIDSCDSIHLSSRFAIHGAFDISKLKFILGANGLSIYEALYDGSKIALNFDVQYSGGLGHNYYVSNFMNGTRTEKEIYSCDRLY